MDPGLFEQAYQGRLRPVWDIGRPQPALLQVLRRGLVRGPVLEVGCGTGENILQMASLGHEAWGIDISPTAIRMAQAKAEARGLPARLLVGNALQPRGLGRRFNTVLDSAFFHGLSDPERAVYADAVAEVLRPGGLLVVLCFSDQDPFNVGPRRVGVAGLVRTFHGTFQAPEVVATHFEVRPHGGVTRHRAWLALLRRRRTGARKAPF